MRRLGAALLPMVLLAAVSCRGPFLVPTMDTASLVLSFAGSGASTVRTAGARTILPAAGLGIDSIHVEVTGPGGTIPWDGGIEDPCTITEIIPGEITVTAAARNGGTVVAEGSETLDLLPGATVSLTIDLVPASSGTGSLSFTMEWPDSTGAAFVECSLSGGTPHEQSETVAPSGGVYTWTYEVAPLDSGDYDLFITFRVEDGGTILGRFVESANVYDGLVSETWLDGDGNHQDRRVFAAQELRDSLTGLAGLAVRAGDAPLVYTPPALVAGCMIDAGRVSRGTVDFIATLANPGCGQTIAYEWNETTTGTVECGVPSCALTLDTVGADYTLEITVTASSGESALYTVTLTRAYRLSYSANGASGSPPPDQLGLPAEVLTVAEPGTLQRTDYTFAGWNTQPTGTGTSYQPFDPLTLTGDTVLYTRWLRNGTVGVSFSLPEYATVVFRYNGAEVITLFVASSEDPLVIQYTDTGSLVSGWQWYVDGVLDAGATGGSYALDISDNGRYVVSCTAVYDGVRYAGSLTVTVNDPLTVSYDDNYADSGSIPVGGTYAEGAPVPVAGNPGGLARSGYTWAGWSPDPAATVPTYTGTGCEVFTMGPTSVTLYAVWADQVPPTDVTDLAAEGGDGCVTLSWTNPADSDFAGVEITYTGGSSGTVTLPAGFSARRITGLQDFAVYTFVVKTYDTGGNRSDGVSMMQCPGTYSEGGSYSLAVPGGSVSITVSGGVVLIAGRTGSPTMLDLPAEVGGFAVNTVEEGAFQNCASLTLVSLPPTVTTIGHYAFSNCPALTEVSIPAVETIGDYAFSSCNALESVFVPATLVSLGEYPFNNSANLMEIVVDPANPSYISTPDGVMFNKTQSELVHYPGGRDGPYAIPGSVTSILPGAFAGSAGLTEVTIPEGVVSIGTTAFASCTGLTTVTIPASVTGVSAWAFLWSSNLAAINVTGGSASFQSLDGVLYNAAGTSLVCYPPARAGSNYGIPATVQTIEGYAFFRSSLSEVAIPASVTTIGVLAFGDCDGITEIDIPEFVTNIGTGAFADSSNLADVWVHSASPPPLGNAAFNNNAAVRRIHVPTVSVGTYQTTGNWAGYAASIEGWDP